MGKLRRGGYLVEGRSPPRHVHVYRDRKLVVKWDVENPVRQKQQPGFHRRDAEFAETEVFLGQELFALALGASALKIVADPSSGGSVVSSFLGVREMGKINTPSPLSSPVEGEEVSKLTDHRFIKPLLRQAIQQRTRHNEARNCS